MNGMTATIIKVITTTGVVGVAIFAIFVLWSINKNDITHLQAAVEKQTEIYAVTTKDTNETLRGMTGAIQLNTEVMRQFLRR